MLSTAARAIGHLGKVAIKSSHKHHRQWVRLASSVQSQPARPDISVSPHVTNALHKSNSRTLETTWADQQTRHFPYAWLRDNCRCPKCFMPTAKSRRVLMRDLDVNSAPSEVKVDDGTGDVTIEWTDGHVSTYTSDWLKERSFTPETKQERSKWYDVKPHFWGAELQDNIPTGDYTQMMSDDRSFLRWLYLLEKYGLFLITGVPAESGHVRKIADKVAFPKKSNYGEIWKVSHRVDSVNLAFTNETLGLHTDQPFYEYTPGMQMLHCINQVSTEGGENQFADAFRVAFAMKERYPELYATLSDTVIDFYDVGEDYYKFYHLYQTPVFVHDKKGELCRIAYNDQVRDSFLNIPVDKVQPWYDALKMYNTMLYDPEFIIHTKLRSGDLMAFHNHRILHGRNGFKVLEEGNRELEGTYLDWDELRSRQRVLKMDLGIEDPATLV